MKSISFSINPKRERSEDNEFCVFELKNNSYKKVCNPTKNIKKESTTVFEMTTEIK